MPSIHMDWKLWHTVSRQTEHITPVETSNEAETTGNLRQLSESEVSPTARKRRSQDSCDTEDGQPSKRLSVDPSAKDPPVTHVMSPPEECHPDRNARDVLTGEEETDELHGAKNIPHSEESSVLESKQEPPFDLTKTTPQDIPKMFCHLLPEYRPLLIRDQAHIPLPHRPSFSLPDPPSKEKLTIVVGEIYDDSPPRSHRRNQDGEVPAKSRALRADERFFHGHPRGPAKAQLNLPNFHKKNYQKWEYHDSVGSSLNRAGKSDIRFSANFMSQDCETKINQLIRKNADELRQELEDWYSKWKPLFIIAFRAQRDYEVEVYNILGKLEETRFRGGSQRHPITRLYHAYEICSDDIETHLTSTQRAMLREYRIRDLERTIRAQNWFNGQLAQT